MPKIEAEYRYQDGYFTVTTKDGCWSHTSTTLERSIEALAHWLQIPKTDLNVSEETQNKENQK